MSKFISKKKLVSNFSKHLREVYYYLTYFQHNPAPYCLINIFSEDKLQKDVIRNEFYLEKIPVAGMGYRDSHYETLLNN